MTDLTREEIEAIRRTHRSRVAYLQEAIEEDPDNYSVRLWRSEIASEERRIALCRLALRGLERAGELEMANEALTTARIALDEYTGDCPFVDDGVRRLGEHWKIAEARAERLEELAAIGARTLCRMMCSWLNDEVYKHDSDCLVAQVEALRKEGGDG
jgi:hypothetical protein